MTSERRIERVLAESQNHQLQLQEQLSHALCSSLTNRMDKVLREDMKKTVPSSKEAQSRTRTRTRTEYMIEIET